MLELFNVISDPAAKEVAMYFPEFGNFKLFRKLKVQNMDEMRTDYATLGQNIETENHTLVLRTRFNFPYKITQHLLYRKEWYEITAINPKQYPSMGLYPLKEYYLSLVQVNYGQDFVRQNR